MQADPLFRCLHRSPAALSFTLLQTWYSVSKILEIEAEKFRNLKKSGISVFRNSVIAITTCNDSPVTLGF